VGWNVRVSIPGKGDDFRTLPDTRWGPPSFLYVGKWFPFPWIKQPGRGVDHTTPSRAQINALAPELTFKF